MPLSHGCHLSRHKQKIQKEFKCPARQRRPPTILSGPTKVVVRNKQTETGSRCVFVLWCEKQRLVACCSKAWWISKSYRPGSFFQTIDIQRGLNKWVSFPGLFMLDGQRTPQTWKENATASENLLFLQHITNHTI